MHTAIDVGGAIAIGGGVSFDIDGYALQRAPFETVMMDCWWQGALGQDGCAR